MSERTYTESEVMRATQAGAQELFGRDTMAASILAGDIAMKLLVGNLGEEESQRPETIDWNSPPDYALRAIRATSTREWLDLITDGAHRLTKSVADYNNRFAREPQEAVEGKFRLSPWIFAEGSTVGQSGNLVGDLLIHVNPPRDSSRTAASVWLRGGEDSPYDHLAEHKQPSFLSRSLSIVRTSIHDPTTNSKRDTYYPEVHAHYDGDMFRGKDGELFKAEFGEPIGAYGHVMVADLFWALDMSITYYETVYIASNVTGNGHIGLTYADLREAGCLKDDLSIDKEKADAYVRSHMTEDSTTWPKLRDRKETKVVMDPEVRAKFEEYKDNVRPTIAVNQPHLLHLS